MRVETNIHIQKVDPKNAPYVIIELESMRELDDLSDGKEIVKRQNLGEITFTVRMKKEEKVERIKELEEE